MFTDDNAHAEVIALIAVAHFLAGGKAAVLRSAHPRTAAHHGVVAPFGDVAV